MSNQKTTAALDPNAKLGMLERIAYGMGDFGGNLIYTAISSFLLVYYVSVVGIPSASAGSILAISRIFDGVSDLIMGRIVDKSNSKRGKALPWLVRMSIPMGICSVAMFSIPANLGMSAKVIYAFITYNLVSTVFYTGYNVPYATLQGLMTTDSYERGLLGNFRMMLATAGTLLVNNVFTRIAQSVNGGGEEVLYAYQRGWTVAAVIMAVGFIAVSFIPFTLCKERVVQNAGDGDAQGPSVMESLKSLVKNKYWVYEVIFLFVLYFMMSTMFGSQFYYVQYVVGDVNAFGTVSSIVQIFQIALMLIAAPFIMKKLGKRITALIGMGAAVVAYLLTALAGTNVPFLMAANAIKGAGFGLGAATMWGLLQDSITYGQWLTNVQAVGMGNAASSFTMKIGSGLGTAALGWILAAGNFDAAPESASAAAALGWSYTWVPLIASVIGCVCLFLFDLDKKYDIIVKDLEDGKWKGTSEHKDL